jgi:hypothetical protein
MGTLLSTGGQTQKNSITITFVLMGHISSSLYLQIERLMKRDGSVLRWRSWWRACRGGMRRLGCMRVG